MMSGSCRKLSSPCAAFSTMPLMRPGTAASRHTRCTCSRSDDTLASSSRMLDVSLCQRLTSSKPILLQGVRAKPGLQPPLAAQVAHCPLRIFLNQSKKRETQFSVAVFVTELYRRIRGSSLTCRSTDMVPVVHVRCRIIQPVTSDSTYSQYCCGASSCDARRSHRLSFRYRHCEKKAAATCDFSDTCQSEPHKAAARSHGLSRKASMEGLLSEFSMHKMDIGSRSAARSKETQIRQVNLT